MGITVEIVKELRDKTGLGIMDCKKALVECNGDLSAAENMLREQGIAVAAKKSSRSLGSGVVDAYIHGGGRIGALVEVSCETDFVARTEDFKAMAHDIAMQIAAMNAKYLTAEEAAEDENPEEVCLMAQPFIKDASKTIQELVIETIAKVGENIKIGRFARFELGE